MHIEFRHLRTIRAIHEAGGLARAADILNITQSALSHQVKGLEDQAGVELFARRSKPLKLSAAGHKLLKLAEKILPELEALELEFSGLRSGKSGRMHIAIECHACFEWLFPVLEEFRKAWPDVDVDIRDAVARQPGQQRGEQDDEQDPERRRDLRRGGRVLEAGVQHGSILTDAGRSRGVHSRSTTRDPAGCYVRVP